MNPVTLRQAPARETVIRPEGEFSRTVASIRKMLAGFERPDAGGDVRLKEKQAKAAAWVAGLVEELVRAATAETEAAVTRVRAEVQADAAQTQALLSHLMGEAELRRQEISELQQRLEAEKTKNTRLNVAFEAFRRAVVSSETTETAGRPSPAQESLQHLEPPAMKRDDASGTSRPTAAAIRPVRLVSGTTGVDSNPELTKAVNDLFERIEADYWSDVQSELRPAELVDRLTESLRRGHDSFRQRVMTANSQDTGLFHQKITELLDSKGETTFGRHLSAAAYSFATPPATRS